MRFLADECLNQKIVSFCRQSGHDIVRSSDIHPSADDPDVLQLAKEAERILLTEDKDFGFHVVKEGLNNSGVILFRYSKEELSQAIKHFNELLEEFPHDV